MRRRGLTGAVLVLLVLAGCSRPAPVEPLPSEQREQIEANREALRLCEDRGQPIADAGGGAQLAWVIVRAEPPETEHRVLDCHFDVDSFPASMPAPTGPADEDQRAYTRVVVRVAENGDTGLQSAVMGRSRPEPARGERLIRVSPRENG